jgi:hypothetical protein
MFSPQWAHLRGASITRGGINYKNALRKILLFDNFNAAPDEVKGLKKIFLRKSCKILTVSTLDEAYNVSRDCNKNLLISFAGHTAHTFDDLWIHRDAIYSSLKLITKKKWYSESHILSQPFIGINVRMGNDFKKASGMKDFLDNRIDYLRTPLDWYVKSLRKTREITGSDYTAIVISDGTEKDLQLLLNEPNVIFSKSESAIGDLLTLTNASVLIGAGRSSFSAWASFLAKIPTITIPGSDLQGFHVSKDCEEHFVGELDPENPSLAFCDSLKDLKKF